jgi:hypothetical protein
MLVHAIALAACGGVPEKESDGVIKAIRFIKNGGCDNLSEAAKQKLLARLSDHLAVYVRAVFEGNPDTWHRLPDGRFILNISYHKMGSDEKH